jgi:queuosine precursor transporter
MADTGAGGVAGRERAYLLLGGLFVAALVIANLIAFKLFVLPLPFGVAVFGRGALVLPAGLLAYPLTFLITDLISELYGRARATAVVWTGFWASLLVLVVVQLALRVPPAGAPGVPPEDVQALFTGVFGLSSRAIVASMIAYLVAQLADVRLFHYWRERTGGRHLWLRNNGSTLFSQFVDTLLIISILFWGILPLPAMLEVMVGTYIFKAVFALLDTPLVYAGVHLLRPLVGGAGPDVEGGARAPAER